MVSGTTACQVPSLPVQVANDTIIMLIGLVYCVIQPIIAPLALIYFAIGVLIWKYQVVYVYVPLVESGGKVWVVLCPGVQVLSHCTCCLPLHVFGRSSVVPHIADCSSVFPMAAFGVTVQLLVSMFYVHESAGKHCNPLSGLGLTWPVLVVVQLWMQIFQHIITAMMFFQIIMIALFGIKKAAGPAVLTAPLPFLTMAFLLYNLQLFNRPQVIISNRTAADIDKRNSQVSPLPPTEIASHEATEIGSRQSDLQQLCHRTLLLATTYMIRAYARWCECVGTHPARNGWL